MNDIIPKWSQLSAFGNSKILSTSYIWLAIVPIGAKLLSSVNEQVVLFGGLTINMTLPFSWKAFFFAAISFSIANLAYRITCPEPLKLFKDWSDFKQKGSPLGSLNAALSSYFLSSVDRSGTKETLKETGVVKQFIILERQYCSPHVFENGEKQTDIITSIEIAINVDDEELDHMYYINMSQKVLDLKPIALFEGKYFWTSQQILDDTYIKLRIVTSAFYILGASLLSWVFVSNVIYVILS